MRCPRCQSQNRERTTFCEDCGARLERACQSCGGALTPGKKFCASNVCALAQAYLLGGRIVEAEQAATRALELCRRQEQRGNEARAMWVLGEIAARSAPAEAGGHYRGALALAEELGMRLLVAHCHLGLGKLCLRAGYGQQAQEHLTAATTMYREIDMGFWLGPAEAELSHGA